MEISRKDQIEFALEILHLVEKNEKDSEQLDHLLKLVSLLVSWSGQHSDVAVGLNEYVYEAAAVARGEEDTGWKEEFKKNLYRDIGMDETNS